MKLFVIKELHVNGTDIDISDILKEVYMIRAAELYEQCIDNPNTQQAKLAKIRLKDIHKKLYVSQPNG